MYIYPDNMKGKANMFLWRLYDVVIIVIGAVISITAIAALNFVFPAALVAAYAFMSIRFEDMKVNLKNRLAEEKNSKVRELLDKDLAFLDRVQIQTASAREFLVIIRFRENQAEPNDIKAGISRIEKLLKEQGFIAARAGKEDIKRIFAVYFVQNLTQVYFDDYDGEKWVKGDEVY